MTFWVTPHPILNINFERIGIHTSEIFVVVLNEFKCRIILPSMENFKSGKDEDQDVYEVIYLVQFLILW